MAIYVCIYRFTSSKIINIIYRMKPVYAEVAARYSVNRNNSLPGKIKHKMFQHGEQ